MKIIMKWEVLFSIFLIAVGIGNPKKVQSRREGCIWWRKPGTSNNNNIANANSNGTSSNSYSNRNTNGKFMLDCHVRSLTSDFWSSHSFSGQQHAATHSLRVRCHDQLFYQSFLPLMNDSLIHLRTLNEVSIEWCKIRQMGTGIWSSLNNLRSLKIQTRNSDWGSSVTLELEPGAFDGLQNLETLDLSENNIWDLGDKNVLCGLQKVRSVNFSMNAIVEFTQLQIHGENDNNLCDLTRLVLLDLSHNKIRHVMAQGFGRAQKMTHLRLDNNLIEEFHDSAFAGLGELKLVNLTANRLVALPPNLFAQTTGLVELYVSENEISSLSPTVFSTLAELRMLDLSRNRLKSLDGADFSTSEKLTVLNLSHNELQKLQDPTIFASFINLKILTLSHNQISEINGNLFSAMQNLQVLDLSWNRLVELPGTLFIPAGNLNQLFLDHNEIISLENSIFSNSTMLKDVGIGSNKLKTIPPALSVLTNLVTLDLGENEINHVTNESSAIFKNLEQLYGLRLVGNQLHDIPPGFCTHLSALRVLNMAGNQVARIHANSFLGCEQMRALRLDNNSLSGLSPSLALEIPSLLWLNVSHNRLTSFDYDAALPRTVEWLDLSHNELTSLQNGMGPLNWNLRVVDVSHNQLTRLLGSSFPPTVERIRVNHNHINFVSPNAFFRLPALRSVELTGNNLSSLDPLALRVMKRFGKPVPEFQLRANPFVCDCGMEWLKHAVQQNTGTKGTSETGIVIDLHAIYCSENNSTANVMGTSASSNGTGIAFLSKKEWLCSYDSHCPDFCHCCDFDACDCKMECPLGCVCTHDFSWSLNIVKCDGDTNVTSILLARIPMDATEIHLDGSHTISVLPSHGLIGKRNLQSLFLNHSHILEIGNKSFNGLNNLQSLHLDHNELTRLDGFEFTDVPNLLQLYLNDNNLRSIALNTFSRLKYLQMLRLEGNQLIHFPLWEFSESNRHLSVISVHDNLWTCECHFLSGFKKWLSSVAIVENGEDLECAVTKDQIRYLPIGSLSCEGEDDGIQLVQPGQSKKMSTEKKREAAIIGSPAAMDNVVVDTSTTHEGVWTLVSILVTLCILLVLIVAIFRKEVCHTCFTTGGPGDFLIRKCKSSRGAYQEEKLFDAYFIYSKPEGDFLADKIGQQLNPNGNYRLCFHHRDLNTATGVHQSATSWWTAVDTELMQSACQATKKIVILVSPSFLPVLTQRETIGALRGGIEGATGSSDSNPKKKIVVVLFPPYNLGNISQFLPPEVVLTMTSGQQVIEWEDPMLWPKLKACLPPPGILASTNGRTACSKKCGTGNNCGSATNYSVPTSLYGFPIMHNGPGGNNSSTSESLSVTRAKEQQSSSDNNVAMNIHISSSSNAGGAEQRCSTETENNYGDHVYSSLEMNYASSQGSHSNANGRMMNTCNNNERRGDKNSPLYFV